MDTDEILAEIAYRITDEAEKLVFSEYMDDLKRGKKDAMEVYASKMKAIRMGGIIGKGRHSSIEIRIPYKSPIGPKGFEYAKGKRVGYVLGESGKYHVESSYGLKRKESRTDKVIENAVLGFAHDNSISKVTIVREKI